MMRGGRKVSSGLMFGCVTQLVSMVYFWFHVSGLGISFRNQLLSLSSLLSSLRLSLPSLPSLHNPVSANPIWIPVLVEHALSIMIYHHVLKLHMFTFHTGIAARTYSVPVLHKIPLTNVVRGATSLTSLYQGYRVNTLEFEQFS